MTVRDSCSFVQEGFGQPHIRLHFRLLLPTQFQRVSKRTTTKSSSFLFSSSSIPNSIEYRRGQPHSRLHFLLLLLLPTQFQRILKRTTTQSSPFPPLPPPLFLIPKSSEEDNHTFVFPSFSSSSQSQSIPKSIKKAYKTGRICTLHKRGWVVT